MHQLDLYTEHLIRHQHATADAQLARRSLIRAALGERRDSLLRPALVRIGRQMVVWGTKLQYRYDDRYQAREIALANK